MMNFSYRPSTLSLLVTLTVIVQCCLALPVLNHETSHEQFKRTISSTVVSSSSSSSSSSASSSQMCTTYRNTCHFYSHCIDSHFYCGPNGFAQAYAQSRCENIDGLRLRNIPSCDNCIQTRVLYEWAVIQDTCLQDKLIRELDTSFSSRRSDPPTCLEMEKKGLELMEECAAEYTTPQFCNAISQSPSIKSDINKIVKHFRINSYYATRVERMLKKVISSCEGEAQIQSIADSIVHNGEGFHSQRMVFCAVIFSDSFVTNTTAVEMAAQELGRDVNQFTFSGYDESRRCVTNYRYPTSITPTDDDLLYFITWTPEFGDQLFGSIGDELHTASRRFGNKFMDLKFYQYTPLSSSDDYPECGDGIRQAGELCDMGVGNVEGTDSDEEEVGTCSLTCDTAPSVECSTQQLGLSTCWAVTCGDGIRSAGEECDDNNLMSGDGCSSDCRVESSSYKCETPYNSTSSCTHISALPQTAPYPAATTSSPSRISTFTSSSLSNSAMSSSSDSSSSTISTSSQLSNQSPTVEQLQATSSQSPSTNLPLNNVALQCLVSVLISWTTACVLHMTR